MKRERKASAGYPSGTLEGDQEALKRWVLQREREKEKEKEKEKGERGEEKNRGRG